MLKKFAAISTAILLLSTGLGTVGVSTAAATTTYSITTSMTGPGTGTIDASIPDAAEFSIPVIHFAATSGSTIIGIKINGVDDPMLQAHSQSGSYTFALIQANQTIEVNFNSAPPPLPPPPPSTVTISNLTSTTASLSFATEVAAHPSVTSWNLILFDIANHLLLSRHTLMSNLPTIDLTGLTPSTNYGIQSGPLTPSPGPGYEDQFLFTTPTTPSPSPSPSPSTTPSPSPSPSPSTTPSPSPSPSTTPSPTTDPEAIAQQNAALAEVAHQALLHEARTNLVLAFNFAASDTPAKPPTLAQYAAAGIAINSPGALARVNGDIARMTVTERSSIPAIQEIVKTENFVDKISNAKTLKKVTTTDLVLHGFLSAKSKNMTSVLLGLYKLDPATLNSVAAIKAAIALQIAKVQARKDRTAAVIAKSNALIAKSKRT